MIQLLLWWGCLVLVVFPFCSSPFVRTCKYINTWYPRPRWYSSGWTCATAVVTINSINNTINHNCYLVPGMYLILIRPRSRFRVQPRGTLFLWKKCRKRQRECMTEWIRKSTRVDVGKKCWILPAIKIKARTVSGEGGGAPGYVNPDVSYYWEWGQDGMENNENKKVRVRAWMYVFLCANTWCEFYGSFDHTKMPHNDIHRFLSSFTYKLIHTWYMN